jgi:hypothetical protein
MTAGLAATDKNSVLVAWLDNSQTAQICDIGIDGVSARDDIKFAHGARPDIQPGKFIGNSIATLAEANNN